MNNRHMILNDEKEIIEWMVMEHINQMKSRHDGLTNRHIIEWQIYIIK